MNKSEQLIACLEGEIAKRDEELAACRVAVENCDLFRARVAELEAKTRTAMGVGGGSGNLFVYGDYDSIKAAQKIVIERDQLRSELAAIKAQEPIGWYTEDHLDDKSATTYSWTVAERWVEKGWPVSPLYADAQAIIDGLRGEVERLDRESQNLSDQLGACGRDRNMFRAERDQQAQRIGELEGLLRSCLPALSDGGCAALANRIAAALSSGKEGSDGIP